MDIIIGTAGHIDHGKTALVKALTGIDADRLPDEKRRGITIDLGFAELDLGDVRVGFVDLPGHERFIKNMLAGAIGIDLVALVIAADEGVMPQTREHFEICRLLETKAGLVILTKTDLVDDELLEIVKIDAAELVQNSFLENAPMIAVSAKTGIGISELKTAIKELTRIIPERKSETVTRLPIDRSFTIKGFGTVATGTLSAGQISLADEMELMPIARKVRVRGIQTHGKSVKQARGGQRSAINLVGIEQSEVTRGQILTPFGKLRSTQIFDAEIEVLKSAKPLKSRMRVRVHLGTSEVLARLVVLGETGEIPPGSTGFAQLRLESPVVALPNDRFILRMYSPQVTIAGGTILDAFPAKHRRRNFPKTQKYLQNIAVALKTENRSTHLRLILETVRENGLLYGDLQARTGWVDSILEKMLAELLAHQAIIDADGIFVSRTVFENLAQKTTTAISNHHRFEPLSRGMPRETLREKVFAYLDPAIFKKALQILAERGVIISDKDIVKLSAHGTKLTATEKEIFDNLQKIYADAGLAAPNLVTALNEAASGTKSNSTEARRVFQLFLDSGEIIKINDDFYLAQKPLTAITKKLQTYAETTPDRMITVPEFKDLSGVSRKYAIPLLEYFDLQKITRRAGDKRLIC